MNKLKNKKNSKRPHISYKYIIAFCATFAICNFFVEEIANIYLGIYSPQVENLRFNQAQYYKSNIEVQKFSKKVAKNNFENSSIKDRKKEFIADLLPIIQNANQDILEKRGILFEIT